MVNGGTEGAAGDTFVDQWQCELAKTTVSTRAHAFDDVFGNTLTGISAATEIVVTRNGTNAASIIAELREIEEIRIYGLDPAGGTTTVGGGDSIQVIGNFANTSLRPNTITIDGRAGDDTIDISALTSAHRIVFKSNGGNDTIIGTLRPQDVIDLPAGTTIADYETTIGEDGMTTLTSDDHTITFSAPNGMPVLGHDDDDDDDNVYDHDDDDDETMTTMMIIRATMMITTTMTMIIRAMTMIMTTTIIITAMTTMTASAATAQTCCAATTARTSCPARAAAT